MVIRRCVASNEILDTFAVAFACGLPLFPLMKHESDERLAFMLARRSIRVYSGEQVSDETVRELLVAAMAAPSAAAKDPWRFVVVRDRQVLSAIAAALPNGQMLVTATLGIIVCGDLDAAHDRQLSYLLQDCSAAIMNLLLAAHVLGLGACWLGIHPREERIRKTKEILGLPDSVIPVGGISLGYPGEVKEPRTRFTLDSVHLDKWGAKPRGPIWT